jgi:Mce-associated membrane protein
MSKDDAVGIDDKADKATSTSEDDTAVGAETKADEVAEAKEVAKGEGVEKVEKTVETGAEDDSATPKVSLTKGADDVEETAVASEDAGGDDDSDDDDSAVAAADDDSSDGDSDEVAAATQKRPIQWSRVVAFGLLPALALVLALGAGYLKWLDDSNRDGIISANPSGHLSLAESSVQAAKDTTIALLSYQPDTVAEQLGAARELLSGEFRESYTALTNDVVIPGAREQQIAAVVSVPAAASVSATPTEAVVLIFVNQTVSVGQEPPTDTASSVRVTLEKSGDRWLVSKFDPV